MQRRALLTLIGMGTTAFAGCLGNSDVPDSDDEESAVANSKFDSVEFEGTDLVVSIEEDTDIQTVNAVIEGEQAFSFTFGEGVLRDRHELDATLYGTTQFIGVDDEGNEIDSVEKTFEPELVVKELRRVEGETISPDNEAFSRSEFPRSSSSRAIETWFDIEATVENVGDAPVIIPENNAAVVVEGTLSQGDEEEMDWHDGKDFDAFYPVSSVPVEPGETKTTDVVGGEFGFHARDMYWTDPPDSNNPAEGRLKAEDLCDNTTETVVVVIFDDRGERHEAELEVTYSGEVIYWKNELYDGWQPYSAVTTCETVKTK